MVRQALLGAARGGNLWLRLGLRLVLRRRCLQGLLLTHDDLEQGRVIVGRAGGGIDPRAEQLPRRNIYFQRTKKRQPHRLAFCGSGKAGA
jgi:hypothetical protein